MQRHAPLVDNSINYSALSHFFAEDFVPQKPHALASLSLHG
jgi:hypothetical protein